MNNNKILLYAVATAAVCTFIAGVLHLAIVPMFFMQMSTDVTIFFIVSGIVQIFWIIPVIKRWDNLWYYIGIGGTAILIIMWFVAVPGSGYPINILYISIEIFQITFIILCYFVITKRKKLMKKPIC
ncbi:MAG: hypothetical protein ACE5SW_05600 [Nitrososphaeraceae archaeon]